MQFNGLRSRFNGRNNLPFGPIFNAVRGAFRPSLLFDFANNQSLVSSAGGVVTLTFTRASDQTYFNSAGVLQTAATDVAAFDYDPTTLAPLGLSLWEARTNSLRNNTMVGAVAGTPGTNPNNWTITTPQDGVDKSIVAVGTTNGVSTIDVRLNGTSSTGGASNLVLFESNTQITAANLDTWTGSIFAALVAGSFTNVSLLSLNIRYNDSGGSLLTSQNVSLLGLGATLQRITNTFAANNASIARVNLQLVYDFTNSAAVDFTLRIGMPQLELGAFATPVIATTAAAATRAAPVCSTTNLSWFNSLEGTFVSRASVGSVAANERNVYSVTDSTDANRIHFRANAPGDTQYVVVTSSVAQAALAGATYSASYTPINTAVAYKSDDFAISANGGAVSADTSGTVPTGLTTLYVGNRNNISTTFINGWLKYLAYYPSRLPNATFQGLSA